MKTVKEYISDISKYCDVISAENTTNESKIAFLWLIVSVCKRIEAHCEKLIKTLEESKEMKDMDLYYHVTWTPDGFIILSTYWRENSNHYERAYCGNVFKTYEEADANKYDVYERLTGKKWKERQQRL